MKTYYECHITFMVPDGWEPRIAGWTYSRIDGDPTLGEGVKSYLTRFYRSELLVDRVIEHVENAAKELADSSPQVRILRTKVEKVVYDNRRTR